MNLSDILEAHAGRSWEDILSSIPRDRLIKSHDPHSHVMRLDTAHLFRFGTHPSNAGPHLVLCLVCKEVVMRDACIEGMCIPCASKPSGLASKVPPAKRARSILVRDALAHPSLDFAAEPQLPQYYDVTPLKPSVKQDFGLPAPVPFSLSLTVPENTVHAAASGGFASAMDAETPGSAGTTNSTNESTVSSPQHSNVGEKRSLRSTGVAHNAIAPVSAPLSLEPRRSSRLVKK
eukprot:ANDGO_05267.mRNA.1 hypothetical protein